MNVKSLLVLVSFGCAIVLGRVFLEPPGQSHAGSLYGSAWLAMIGWFLGAYGLIRGRSWAACCWSLGCGFQLLHVAIAFHTVHSWSHAHAFEHTRQVGGFGEGIYANYLFTLLWLADAAWLQVAPCAYRRRPKWLSGTIHGYLVFLVFNALVVFGSTTGRLMFGGFLVAVLADRLFARRSGG